MARKDAAQRSIWLWDKVDWHEHTDWEALLMGDAEGKACALTSRSLALQQQYVPSRMYLTRLFFPSMSCTCGTDRLDRGSLDG